MNQETNIYLPIKLVKSEKDALYPFMITLSSWEHRDYIEDVLIEKFNIEINTISETTIYFEKTVDEDNLYKAISAINIYHSKNQSTYAV